jgi:ArsR family transcriptional regulator
MSKIEYNHMRGDKLDLIEIFKALGDKNRIRILNLLIRQELCVCEIETMLNMTQSNASRHLNKLKTSGVITSEKKSQWVYYRIDNKFIEENNLLYEFIKNKTVENTQLQRDVERSLIMEMESLTTIYYSGKYKNKMSEATKVQREILKAFGIEYLDA